MKTLVHVTAQTFENYNFYDGGEPRWKPKGRQLFSLMVDDMLFMYMTDECVEAIKNMLQAQSGSHTRYEYVSHDLIFHGITPLNDEIFAAEVKNITSKQKAQ